MFKNLIAEIKDLSKKKNEGFRDFIIRFSIFIILTGIISTANPYYKQWLEQPYYSTNGGFYKFLFFFILIIFIIAHKEKIEKVYPYKNKIKETIIFFVLSILSFSIPFTLLSQNLNINPIVSNFLLYSIGVMFIALAVFNKNFLFRYMQEESLKLILLTMAYFSAPLIFKNLWVFIFEPIKIGINIISNISSGNAIISGTEGEIGFIVDLKNFRVGVGPACSGIQSIIAFTILFISAVVFLKKDRLFNKKNIFLTYVFGIIILYIINIIRIITLIYIGAYISKEFAIDMFHEYFSSLAFLALFLIFIKKYSDKLFIKDR